MTQKLLLSIADHKVVQNCLKFTFLPLPISLKLAGLQNLLAAPVLLPVLIFFAKWCSSNKSSSDPFRHSSDGRGAKWLHCYLLLIKIKLLCKALILFLTKKLKPLPQWKF